MSDAATNLNMKLILNSNLSKFATACLVSTLGFLFVCVVLPFTNGNEVYAVEIRRGDNAAQIYVDRWRKNIDSLSLVKFSAFFVDWIEHENGTRTPDNRLHMDWIIDFASQRYWKGVFAQDDAISGELYDSESFVTNEKALFVSKFSYEDQIEIGVGAQIEPGSDFWKDTLALSHWGFSFGYIDNGDTKIFLPDFL